MSYFSELFRLTASVFPSYFVIASAAAAAAAAAVLIVDYRHRRRRFEFMSKKGRLLSQVEAQYQIRRNPGEGVDANVLFIDSSLRPIDVALLSAAAARLAAKHPALRSRIASASELCQDENDIDEYGGKFFYYFVEIKDFRPDVEISSTSDWETAFDEEVHTSFDDSGPLWRLRLLPSTRDEEKYKNVVFATFFHSISDGRSIMRFVDELLEAMKDLVEAEAKGETLPPAKSLRQSPPITGYLPKRFLDPPMVTRLMTFLKLKFYGEMRLKPFVNCAFIEATRDERSKLRSPGKTRLIPILFDEDDLKTLLRLCKSFHCKLHGALDSAFHLALSATIDERRGRGYEERLEITSAYNINANHLAVRQPDEEYFGDHTSYSVRTTILSAEDRKEESFWRLAKKFHDHIHGRLAEYPFSEEMRDFEFIHRLFPAQYHRYCDHRFFSEDEELAFLDYALSNRGACDFMEKPEPRPFELTGTFYGMYMSGVGVPFYHYVVTVGGKLHWSMTYCEDYVTEETAKRCAAHLKKILKRVVKVN